MLENCRRTPIGVLTDPLKVAGRAIDEGSTDLADLALRVGLVHGGVDGPGWPLLERDCRSPGSSASRRFDRLPVLFQENLGVVGAVVSRRQRGGAPPVLSAKSATTSASRSEVRFPTSTETTKRLSTSTTVWSHWSPAIASISLSSAQCF